MKPNPSEWKPNPKQELFLSLPWTIKEGAYLGGAGSGKSDVLLLYGILNKWHLNPRFKQVFQRRTFPELRNEIIPRSRQFYTKLGATLNKSDMAWTFPAPDQFGGRGMSNMGAMIFLGQCEDENDVHKYDSMEINLYTPDEITSFAQFIYMYIAFTRVRTSDSSLPAIIRTAGMPGGVGHTWVKKRFIDPYKEGGKVIIGKGGNKRIMIFATQADNKDHIDPNYAQSLEALPEAEKRAKLHGDFDAYQGQVFDEFRDRRFPDEPDNALHVYPPFNIPSWWPRIVVGDWGFAAMAYIGFYAISPDSRLILYRELHWLKTKISEWAPIVKDFCDREEPRSVKFCKSAGHEQGQEHTIQQQISDALGRSIELSNNSPGSRIAGKMLLHEYLRWKPKPTAPRELIAYDEEYALWLLRNKNEEHYRKYLEGFNPPEEEKNLPKLIIFRCDEEFHDGHPNCCPVMIESLKACSYDKKSRDGKPAEDVAEFEGDDPYDDLRYAVDSAERYFAEAKEEFDKVKKQQELIQLLEKNQDWTAFYRNMSKTEQVNSIGAVSRYHRSIH
jgi:hypothetical protein